MGQVRLKDGGTHEVDDAALATLDDFRVDQIQIGDKTYTRDQIASVTISPAQDEDEDEDED